MQRYHFNVYGDDVSRDYIGTELPDEDAARLTARRYASELLLNDATIAKLGGEWFVETRNEEGTVLFRIAVAILDGDRRR